MVRVSVFPLGRLGDENWRRVVMHEIPRSVARLEDICGLGAARAGAAPHSASDVFRTAHPGRGTVHADGLHTDRDAHGIGITKHCLPAFADRFPSFQQVPSGVNALDPVFLQPYGVHLFETEILQGAVETPVGLPNLFLGGR